MKHGVPFDVAFSVDADTRLGWLIQFGRMDGGKWNYTNMQWD